MGKKNKKKYKLTKIGKIFFTIVGILFVYFIYKIPSFFVRIDLVGGDLVLDYGDAYSEPGYKASSFFTDVTKDVEVIDMVENRIGSYKVEYSFNFLFYKVKKVRNVTIRDISGPKITLNGDKIVSIEVGSSYEEMGASASDNLDGDVSSKIVISSTLDNTVIGKYEVIYLVKDSSGNESREVRVVNVERKNPTTLGVAEYTLDGFFDDVKLGSSSLDGEEYFRDLVFVGDSNIKNTYESGLLYKKAAWYLPCITSSSYFTDKLNVNGEQMLLLDAVNKYKPKVMVLNLGVFSTTWIDFDTFISKSNELLDKIKEISPDTKIILSSLYPVASENNINKFSQSSINKYNYYILEMASKHNIKYLDVQTILKGEDGYGLRNYYLSDNFHFTTTGMRVFLNYVKTHAWED